MVSCSYHVNKDSKTAFLNEALKEMKRSGSSDLNIITTRIQAETAKILCDRYDMECMGFGGGWAGKKKLNLSFEVNRIIDKETARSMLVDCVEEFIIKINASEELKPYLEEMIFTDKNIRLNIFVTDVHGNDVYQPNISVFKSIEGRVAYCYESPEKEYGYMAKEHETFQEALAILKEENKGSTQITSENISITQEKQKLDKRCTNGAVNLINN